jgi:hypothetical protein
MAAVVSTTFVVIVIVTDIRPMLVVSLIGTSTSSSTSSSSGCGLGGPGGLRKSFAVTGLSFHLTALASGSHIVGQGVGAHRRQRAAYVETLGKFRARAHRLIHLRLPFLQIDA